MVIRRSPNVEPNHLTYLPDYVSRLHLYVDKPLQQPYNHPLTALISWWLEVLPRSRVAKVWRMA